MFLEVKAESEVLRRVRHHGLCSWMIFAPREVFRCCLAVMVDTPLRYHKEDLDNSCSGVLGLKGQYYIWEYLYTALK